MLMNDFKKVRGYNPILFLRAAIESSKAAARGATRAAAIAECRNFLCLISWGHSTAAKRRKAAYCGNMWHFRCRWHERGSWWQKVANCGTVPTSSDHFPPTNTGSGT
jgi:hypothetical protein